mmetsp:Transcript_18851/g.57999  ORF Transcript_18851/g.57999 Transcript_18851/m.57999 type:complete len:313 (-) Transcript_18851:695-1633(-)
MAPASSWLVLAAVVPVNLGFHGMVPSRVQRSLTKARSTKAEWSRRLGELDDSSGGWKTVAARGRELRRCMDLTEDELRAALVGRGVDVSGCADKQALAKLLADVRVAEERPFSAAEDARSSWRRTTRPSLFATPTAAPDVVSAIVHDVPKAAVGLATELAKGARLVVEEVADAAQRSNSSGVVQDFLQTATQTAVRAAQGGVSAVNEARRLHTKKRGTWLLDACLAVADWAAGPFLRREVVLFFAVAAPLLTRSGPFASVLTLLGFRLLRDVFAKLHRALLRLDGHDDDYAATASSSSSSSRRQQRTAPFPT